MMTRSVPFSLDQANLGKKATIRSVFIEAKRVIQIYIDYYWDHQEYTKKFTNFKVDSWLSACLLQVLGKQALDIMRSLKKKHKKSKPELKNLTLTLDERFFPDLKKSNGHFDLWFKLSGLGKRGHEISLRLPIRAHKVYKKFLKDNWSLKNSFRLRLSENHIFLDLIFEKPEPEIKTEGRVIGIDMGYRHLVVTSDRTFHGTEIQDIYRKLVKKQRGSKSMCRVLRERDCAINQTINQMPLNDVRAVVIEALKDVKRNTKKTGRTPSKVMNYLQWWSYPKTVEKLKRKTEECGIGLVEVPPAYTSQTCPRCGSVHRENRPKHGEKFRCIECGYADHSDYVGAVNILRRGEVHVDRYLLSSAGMDPTTHVHR